MAQQFHKALIAIFAFTAIAAQAQPAGEQAEQFTPEFRQTHATYDAKHSPKIEAPDSVKRGEWFTVMVTVGSGSMHPSLQEHFVRYIALYKDSLEISRVYLHPVYSAPKVTFTVAVSYTHLTLPTTERV